MNQPVQLRASPLGGEPLTVIGTAAIMLGLLSVGGAFVSHFGDRAATMEIIALRHDVIVAGAGLAILGGILIVASFVRATRSAVIRVAEVAINRNEISGHVDRGI